MRVLHQEGLKDDLRIQRSQTLQKLTTHIKVRKQHPQHVTSQLHLPSPPSLPPAPPFPPPTFSRHSRPKGFEGQL